MRAFPAASGKRPLRTRTTRLPARNQPAPRSRIRGKQQSSSRYRVPCEWVLRAWVVAADNSLLLCLAARIEIAPERSAACSGGGGGWAAGRATRSSLGAISHARGGVMSELLLDAAGRRRSPA